MLDDKNQGLPARFDPQVLAECNLALTGQVSVAAMSRLKHAAVSIRSDAEIDLSFSRGSVGHCKVDGKIICTVGLRCDRCLDELEVCLRPIVKLILIQDHAANLGQTESYDLYEYSGKNIKLTEFVEDELLLAFPLAPKHKEISLCNQDVVAWLATCCRPKDNTRNPFAKLRY